MLNPKNIDITETVERIVSNDQKAFKTFFEYFQPSIFHFLYRYTFDYNVAEDLCQETFVKFWISRNSIDPSGSPKAYLFKIARNMAINHMGRLSKTTSINDELVHEQNLCSNPSRDYDMKLMMKDFQNAIILLPEHCRVIFMLSRYHDFSYAEIAETLEISLQTVKNQMNKSLGILRESLRHYNT